MQRCGICSFLSSLFRRVMCLGSRRGSSESYYRELGDQDTLKIEDRSTDSLEDIDEIQCQSTQIDEALLELFLDLDKCGRDVPPEKYVVMGKRRKKVLTTRTLIHNKALLDDIYPGMMNLALKQSANWRFNAFILDNVSGGRCLSFLGVHLFEVYDLFNNFDLDIMKLRDVLCLIEAGYYSSNPYHNTVHAADVTQAMHCFLKQTKIGEHMTPVERMASLIAAMGHDIDHPGINQPFMVATCNHLAIFYNNMSVLENHHWRSVVSCLRESRLLKHLDPQMQRQVEQLIRSLIMATDINMQQQYLCRFKAYIDTNTLDMTKAEHRLLVLQIALKCADISNPCRSWDISRKWSLKVCEEFFRQGDFERELNIPVTAFCDRYQTSIPSIQKGFLGYVVTPLIAQWHRFLNNKLSSTMEQNLKTNQQRWIALATPKSTPEVSVHEVEKKVSEDSKLLSARRRSQDSQNESALQEQQSRSSMQSVRRIPLAESEHSLSACSPMTSERALSTEKLLPNSSSMTQSNSRQASRLSMAFKNGSSWKLVRQQTFPALEVSRPHALAGRLLRKFTGNIFESRIEIEGLRSMEPRLGRRESAPVGSQLRDNLMSTSLNALGPDLLRRRKSMPTDTPSNIPKRARELAQLGAKLQRTLSNKRLSKRAGTSPAHAPLSRRGSLPAEVLTDTSYN